MAQKGKQKKRSLRYMILAIIIAVAVWSLISYTDNPEISKNFHNIKVSFNGETQMKKNGYVVINKEEIPELSVKVSGQRGDLIQALDNVKINVDLSDITAAGDYDLTGTVQLPGNKLSLEKQNFSTVPVTVDEYVPKEIPLEVRIIGADKKMLESVPAHDTITINGAKSEIKDIANAYVTIDAHEVQESGDMSREITLTDIAGNVLNKPESVDMDEYIAITNTLYKKTNLPVIVKLSDGLNTEIDISTAEITPSSVEIGVLPDSEITEVTALITDIADGETKAELQPVKGLYIPDDVKTVKVKFAVKQENKETDG